LELENLDRWIKSFDITHDMTIDLDSDYSLHFLNRSTFVVENQRLASARNGIYVRIDSQTPKHFNNLLRKKESILHFFNFVVTEGIVSSKSTYGIIEGTSREYLIPIKYKSFYHKNSNKYTVRSPVLFYSTELEEERLKQIIRNWFVFRKSYKTMYNYYVDSLYEGEEPVELLFFKLVEFSESYHRELLEKKADQKYAT
jgi:hypothetical protein